MDAMQILVVILSITLAFFLVLATVLVVQLIKITKQIKDIAASTQSAAQRVNNFVGSAAQLVSPAFIAKLVVDQIKKFKTKKEK